MGEGELLSLSADPVSTRHVYSVPYSLTARLAHMQFCESHCWFPRLQQRKAWLARQSTRSLTDCILGAEADKTCTLHAYDLARLQVRQHQSLPGR